MGEEQVSEGSFLRSPQIRMGRETPASSWQKAASASKGKNIPSSSVSLCPRPGGSWEGDDKKGRPRKWDRPGLSQCWL